MIEIRNEAIKNLIQQREPMIMVDALYDVNESEADTGLMIANENMFCNDGIFAESGLIEHIAQSASAFVGYKALLANKTPPLGFIGEVKKCRVHFLPRVCDELRTHISLISEVLDVSLFAAETKVSGETAVQCQMKIYIKPSSSFPRKTEY